MFHAEGLESRHPSVQSLAQYFTYDHLNTHLRNISAASASLAKMMIEELDDSPELTAGLRKLLEAKDCFVRAALTEQDKGNFDWRDR